MTVRDLPNEKCAACYWHGCLFFPSGSPRISIHKCYGKALNNPGRAIASDPPSRLLAIIQAGDKGIPVPAWCPLLEKRAA